MTQSRPLVLIAAAHTLIWLSIEACVIYVLGAGLAGRSDRTRCDRGRGSLPPRPWFSRPTASVAP